MESLRDTIVFKAHESHIFDLDYEIEKAHAGYVLSWTFLLDNANLASTGIERNLRFWEPGS